MCITLTIIHSGLFAYLMFQWIQVREAIPGNPGGVHVTNNVQTAISFSFLGAANWANAAWHSYHKCKEVVISSLKFAKALNVIYKALLCIADTCWYGVCIFCYYKPLMLPSNQNSLVCV